MSSVKGAGREEEFAPAPWFVESDPPIGHEPYVLDRDGLPVARPLGSEQQYEATRRLIAAAPDLLAALEEYVERQEQESSGPEDLDGLPEYEKACAAIAKARGQTNDATPTEKPQS